MGGRLVLTAHDHNMQVTTMTTLDCAILLRCVMTLLLLEALGALVLLVFIVWWTMFSGRKNGELKNDSEVGKTSPADKL
jgi:hypothetical protein